MNYKNSLSAGYILGAVNNLLTDEEKKLLRAACRFKLSSNADLSIRDSKQEDRQILGVLNNIISRGFPTFCSLYIEKEIGLNYGQSFNFEDLSGEEEYEHEYMFRISEDSKDIIASASVLIEPRCTSINKQIDEFMGSRPAKTFYDSLPPHIKQFTQPERLFDDGIVLGENEENFYRRQVDFAIETPTGIKWIIEVDGKQHETLSQEIIDNYRDEAIYESGWKMARIPVSAADYTSPSLRQLRKDLEKDKAIKRAKSIADDPLWNIDEGFNALHFALSPIAISRAQLAICKAAFSGNLNLQAKSLQILCIERDVSYALLAIEDFFRQLSNLYKLAGIPFKAPDIDVQVVLTEEFSKNREIFREKNFHFISNYSFVTEEELEKHQFDLILDLSVLEKVGLKKFKSTKYLLSEAGIELNIRSEFNTKPIAKIVGVGSIDYPDFNESVLEDFLKLLFRKKSFRDGQVKILKRALSGQDTIGLLPTGSGKSLCYQLATLLQPGISIIIEPLKALMLDQHRNLKNMLIEHCVYINSDIDAKRRKEIEKRWARSEYQYIWVSPERLQIKEFRGYLQELTRKMPVIYAVIDEAHCVSEWGHDFRTSYLMMSKTLRTYCEFEGRQPIFYGLTATASETVLKDIELELVQNSIGDPKIKPQTFDRKELNFKIYNCSSSEKFDSFKEAIGEICRTFDVDSNELFEPAGSDTLAGLIFCPHVNSTDFSIKRLSAKISDHYNFSQIIEKNEPITPVCPECGIEMVERQGGYGTFWGCANYPTCTHTEQFSSGEMTYYDRLHMYSGSVVKGFDKSMWDKYKIQAQSDFIEDKVPLMVSTKAFGMGIDKPNIRYTIHYNIPSSLEAYYQEAGRAGRDGSDAVNVIIFSDDSVDDARKRLSTKKSASEIRQIERLPRGEEGDIHRMLFFQTLSFKGFEEELKTIREILNYDLHESYSELDDGQIKEITIEDRGNNTEKAIYRLSLIGLVKDYTIEFSHPRSYHVVVNKEPFEKYSKTLYSYIRRHGIPQQDSVDLRNHIESEENFYSYVNSRDYNHFITKCCAVLLEYIYATIEPQRRRALLNLVNALETGDPNQFRKNMLRYLSPDEEFNELFNVFPDKDLPEDWIKIFKKADNEDTTGKLLGIALRYLESYPSNPGLLFIAAGLRLSLPGENAKLALDDFEAALLEIDLDNYGGEIQTIFKTIFEYLFRNADLYPKTIIEIANQSSGFLESPDFDFWIYQFSPIEKLKLQMATKLIANIDSKTQNLLLNEYFTQPDPPVSH